MLNVAYNVSELTAIIRKCTHLGVALPVCVDAWAPVGASEEEARCLKSIGPPGREDAPRPHRVLTSSASMPLKPAQALGTLALLANLLHVPNIAYIFLF